MEVMMILGRYAFGLNTAAFQELNRSTEWRWPGQDVFEGVPALQFTGYGKDTITLPGVIFPEYWGGTGQLDALRLLADDAQPQTLIDGRGNVLGEYVITGVQERQAVFAGAGVPLRQEFTITLERYARGDAPAIQGGGLAGAQIAADARAARTGAVLAGRIATDAGARAAGAFSSLTAAAASIDALVGSVVTPLTAVIGAVNQGLGVARSLQTTATVAQQTIQRLGNIRNLSDAQAALNGLILTTGSAAQAATSGSRAIQDTLNAMAAAGEAVGAISTVRGAMIDLNRLAVGSTNVRKDAEDFVGGFQ